MSDQDFDSVEPKTVFMFPGQGAQTVGMGAEVAKEVRRPDFSGLAVVRF